MVAIKRMTDAIQLHWRPNCANGAEAQVRVSFVLGSTGEITGQVAAVNSGNVDDLGVQSAIDRAVEAVRLSAPFEGLPRDYYGQKITLNFKARDACAAR
jgi:hypothetical protein